MIEGLLVFSCVITWSYCVSPESRGLRPSYSGIAPDLIEPIDPSTEPRPRDLNVTVLAAILGPALDLEYSSVAKPSNTDFAAPHFPFRRNRKGRLVPTGPMPKHVKDVELGFVRLSDGTKLKTRVPNKLRRKLRQLLWALTACPVSNRWRDLGPRFWPRWLKEGHCPANSCSVPAGMKCKPSRTAHKYLLRWHCRKSCTWIKVQYPVVTECACSCGQGGYK
ncbi:noggin-like [Cimex lectularius]|uniref:Noggin n=1 Tax=Cimex lectularius TaxID=79782 RepID=A0A8I6REP3_CIMLE|nr:noggin-like [Cimex lectularius]